MAAPPPGENDARSTNAPSAGARAPGGRDEYNTATIILVGAGGGVAEDP